VPINFHFTLNNVRDFEMVGSRRSRLRHNAIFSGQGVVQLR
jgi:hypothetical protein